MDDPDLVTALLEAYARKRHDFRMFMEGVVGYVGEHPDLNLPHLPVVHSYKSRLKDPAHLKTKLLRKSSPDDPITLESLFFRITDLAGVRILHLFQEDFRHIDAVVRHKVLEGDWVLSERPMACTWDPDSATFFSRFDVAIRQKPTSYTSVHYVIRPRLDSPICCELQVRTLFEEIWGEVDHRLNYPSPTQSVACREQIAVLAKLVGAGSRLLDALHRVQSEPPSDEA